LLFLGPAEFVALDRAVLIALFDELNALVVCDQFRFLGLRGAAEPIVGRIAQDNDDLRPAFYPLRSIEFRPHFRKVEFDIVGVVPAGESVRQEDGNAMRLIRCRSKLIEQQVKLKLRYRERRSQDFKAHDALVEGAGQFKSEGTFVTGALELCRNASGDFQKVCASAAARIRPPPPTGHFSASDRPPAAGALDAQAKADLETARLNLGYTEICSPIDGYVGNRAAQVGAYVANGAYLVSVIPAHGLWVDANFKEDQLAEMRPGQPATIVADVLPGRAFRGHVESLAPGTGAVFSVIPPENATGNFTKIVQRVPVRIALDDGAASLGELRPGLSTTVSVDTKPGSAARE
jgi:Barrel-sandwich domain of CusB or HlyD membrane-fusion